MINMLVAYHSRTGHTRTLANAIADGARQANVKVDVKEVQEIKVEHLADYDAIVIGSPSYYCTMAAEVKHLFDESIEMQGKLNGRVGGAFATCARGGGGAETTLLSIISAMLVHGMIIPGGTPYSPLGPVGMHAAAGMDVDQDCRLYGKMIARITARLRA